jgi:hypothetical protein
MGINHCREPHKYQADMQGDGDATAAAKGTTDNGARMNQKPLATHRHCQGSKAFTCRAPLRAGDDCIHAFHAQEADLRRTARLRYHILQITQKLEGGRGRYCAPKLQKHSGTGMARLADLLVGDNRHELSGAFDKVAVRKFAGEDAAGHHGKWTLECAGGGNYRLSCLENMARSDGSREKKVKLRKNRLVGVQAEQQR